MTKVTPLDSPQLQALKSEHWTVKISGAPILIDYIAKINPATDQVVSLTQFWHIANKALKITSSDFKLTHISEYNYYFKRKTKNRYVFSKTKLVEIESSVNTKLAECKSSTAIFRINDGIISLDSSTQDGRFPVPLAHAAERVEPELAELFDSTNLTGLSQSFTRTPLRLFELSNKNPTSSLLVVYSLIGGELKSIFAQLIGEEINERDYSFFRESKKKTIRIIERTRRFGYQSQSYYLNPHPPASRLKL